MKQTFKPYRQNEQFLLPPSLEDLIPENHLVRVVNKVIDRIKIDNIIIHYKGGGASAYHPQMLLKVIVYGYLSGICTGRKIAKALRENINFMWLSGMQRPDFRTINNFRSGRLKYAIKEIFKEVVNVAVDLGLVDFEKLFIDGTKMEANANKYRIIWSKNVKRYKEKIDKELDLLLEEIDRLNKEEDEKYKGKDLPELGEDLEKGEGAEKIIRASEKIDKSLSKRRQKLLKKEENLRKRQMKYEEQEKALSGRNGCSKTDPEATAMMMKNGEIKAAYTVMAATENQVIVNYKVHQNPGETQAFVGLMEDTKKTFNKTPDKVVGDQAYGSEENYEYCKRNKIQGCLKYKGYHLEKKKKFRENQFLKENFRYDKKRDTFICPNGKELTLENEKINVTSNRFKQKIKTYACKDCSDCPMKDLCTKGRNRSIQINENLEKLKKTAKKLLESEEGKQLRKQRSIDVETAFGDIKHNQKLGRFLLRGLEKVNIEFGLMSIAHNLKKIFKKILGDKGGSPKGLNLNSIPNFIFKFIFAKTPPPIFTF